MTKAQAEAFQSLGFSATQLAKDMQNDAQGTIFKVLEAVAAKPKELQTAFLTEMFGQESLGAIAPLLQNLDNLRQAFDLVSDSAKYAGSMQAEFETRSKTVENALQLLSNKLPFQAARRCSAGLSTPCAPPQRVPSVSGSSA